MTENELIAKFMGIPTYNEVGKGYLYNDPSVINQSDLKFDSSWDWLMTVVEKIESLGYTTSFKTRYVRINPKEDASYYNYISWVSFNKDGWHIRTPAPRYDDKLDGWDLASGDLAITKKEAIYKAVVTFINWYNDEN